MYPRELIGHTVPMADDDDDWVGTPPEGHYTRDRADPEFWWRQKPVSITATLIVVVIVVLVIVMLVS
jgi:hypothetical protein